MTKAAGILFVSTNGTALLLRRTATAPDCPACWDFPGGTAEGDETAEQAAVRECREEIGFVPEGIRVIHTRTKSSSAPGPGVAGAGATSVIPVPTVAPEALPVPAVEAPPDAKPMGPSLTPDVDFTTFLQRATNEFVPELNDEHDGFCWAPVDSPPEPLHPGCRIALDRLGMNELDVARAIAEGLLTSPQRYENMMLWAIRITGTGASFRPKYNEFVYRKVENHLTPDALARFNGLPVIMMHPKKSLLNSSEFRNRIVGTIFLPYVAGDEAWGIAKIYDDDANKLLEDEVLSTSPGVNFRDTTVNRKLRLEDGEKVLVEGDPSLYDHVAICALGVWDKGGEPTGIRSEAREDSAMADKTEDEKAKDDAAKNDMKRDDTNRDDAGRKDAAKKDEEEGKKEEEKREDADAGKDLDNKLSHVLDAVKSCADAVAGIGKRMDAMEGMMDSRRGDAAKKDEEEDPEKKGAEKSITDKSKKDDAKDDAHRDDARADSAIATVNERIASVDAAVRELRGQIVPLSDDDHSNLADAWARADDVYTALGKKTPRPMPGETASQFRRRIAKDLKGLSSRWKDADASKAFADDATFGTIEAQIFADAAVAARNPANIPPGALRMVERKRDGHIVREFYGQPRDWMDEIAGATQLRATGAFNTGNLGRSH